MSDVAISVEQVSKHYRLWSTPAQRLISPVREAWRRMRAQSRTEPAGYRDFQAVRDVSFQVRAGQSMAIIGRNGSGKSTLLQMVAGTMQPSSGRVAVRGRVAALLELGSGFNPDFTGRENVFLNAAVLGLARSEIEARFDRIAAFADIGDFMEEPVKTYSSGMALRLAFAVIAHIDASVLLIDEALAVGDVYFMQKCFRFLRDFRERGTMLFVSHDMGAVRSLCDTALWLDRGQMRQQGPAADVAAAFLAEANLSQTNPEVVEVHETPAVAPVHRESYEAGERHLPTAPVANVLAVAPFNSHATGFGDGRVKVTDAAFIDREGRRLDSIQGGDVVCLAITGRGIETTGNVIFGFNLKDRLGQHLFGENTFRGGDIQGITIHPGEVAQGRFTFQMPVLHTGHYTIIAAIASGTPDNHRQQDWLHEALVITSQTDWSHAGLVGIPMLDVTVVRSAPIPTPERHPQLPSPES
ncbi:MAG TPA: ABC transporter ATP-binding protein [Candidatus Didemnitutus sp.]|nr:ABC transporter ATP-binding protein [Candidatus Didemnitutus sp.]